YSVTFDVPAKLRSPVPLVASGLTTMFRTYVPETAVDEHGDLPSGEHEIRTHPYPICKVKPEVLPVPITARMQGPTQGHLGLRVRPSVRPHVPRAPLR